MLTGKYCKGMLLYVYLSIYLSNLSIYLSIYERGLYQRYCQDLPGIFGLSFIEH